VKSTNISDSQKETHSFGPNVVGCDEREESEKVADVIVSSNVIVSNNVVESDKCLEGGVGCAEVREKVVGLARAVDHVAPGHVEEIGRQVGLVSNPVLVDCNTSSSDPIQLTHKASWPIQLDPVRESGERRLSTLSEPEEVFRGHRASLPKHGVKHKREKSVPKFHPLGYLNVSSLPKQ
jgi:hypothetical protein